jgi:uncharacterized protein with GYD domain
MLFLVSADYTPQAITAMRQNPTQTRQEALNNLCEAAGAKVVAMYGTIVNGPGAVAIIDADEISGPAIGGLIASSGAVQNVQIKRLFTMEEISKFRARAKELQGSYKAPGQ